VFARSLAKPLSVRKKPSKAAIDNIDITTAAKKVKDFRLLLDANVKWEQVASELPWLVDLAKQGLIKIRKSRDRIPHWLIVDRKHIRLEKMHPPEEIGSENIILLNTDEAICDLLNLEWSKMWENALNVQ
jgi:hypothetical protein